MITTSKYDELKQVLAKYNKLAIDSVLSYLPNKEPRKYLYDLVSSYPKRPGKGFRPGLCIATCKAFGGNEEMVLKSSTAIEMFHNAFLVHDDIEDESEYRRGSETLNKSYGNAIAVNVGDALNVLSIRPLMENLFSLGPNMTWTVFTEIEHMVRQSVEGQAMELGWIKENKILIQEEDYLRMILKKTCWYTIIHPMRIGYLTAIGDTEDIDKFNRFGYYMGSAFQIQDDLLNLVGDVKKYGKEILGDIWEGKRTLILIHLLNNCSATEREKISQFLNTPRKNRNEEDVCWIFDLMQKYKSISYATKCAQELAGAALREYMKIFGYLPDSEDKTFIKNIILYMIERDL